MGWWASEQNVEWADWMDNPNPYTVMTTREPALLTIMLICLGQYLSFVMLLAWTVCQNFVTKYKSHLFANGSTASGHLYFSSTSPCYIYLFSGSWNIAYDGDPLYGGPCCGSVWSFLPLFLNKKYILYEWAAAVFKAICPLYMRSPPPTRLTNQT